MTDAQQTIRPRSFVYRMFTGRWLFLLTILVGVVAYLIGLNVGYLDIAGARQLIQQLRTDNQKLKTQIADLNATQVALQNRLSVFEAALDEIIPSKNTYNIKPNQSMIVAAGRLTVGMIGAPTNENITVASGDVVNLTLDPKTNCLVRVQSFDMFKAVLYASCTPTQ